MNPMIKFPDEPDVEPITVSKYKLRAAYEYVTLDNVRILVPENFETDLLSAPRFVWTLLALPPDGLYRNAAVVHDWLYTNQGYVDSIRFTRAECDGILLEVMRRMYGVDGKRISWIQRNLAYLAVRLFGGTHWKK